MFVPCPHCGFLIAKASKEGATPTRCPRCHERLDGDARPSAGSEYGSGSGAGHANAPGPDATDASAVPSTAPAKELAAADTTANPPAAGGSRQAPPRSTPDAAAPGARGGGPSFARVRIDQLAATPRWPALLAVLSLAVLLAVQLLLSQRAELARRAEWRPVVEAACAVFRCGLPAWREPEAYTMLDRSVRPVPDVPGRLRINASFRNDARWPQAWPILQLTLSDADGRQVGQRAFRSDEYRIDYVEGETLAPGQSTTVAFEVVEPAADIVAYSFDFR